MNKEVNTLPQALKIIVDLQDENAKLKCQIGDLNRQLDWFNRQIFGHKSEKLVDLSSNEVFLPGLEPEKNSAKSVPTETVHEHNRKKRETNGWNEIPENLPCEVTTVTDPKAEADGWTLIGYEESKRIARREIRFFVKVIKRAKYANPNNPLDGIITAAMPDEPFGVEGARTKFDSTFVTGIVVDKIENHLPLYRQSEIMSREGLPINRCTLQNLFTRAAKMLNPLYEVMKKLVDESPIVHGDETPVRLQQPGQGKCKTAYIWVKMTAVGPPVVIFHFANSRSQEVAKELYKDYYGTIIRDQYVGYDVLPAEHAGCWAHVRRRFFEAEHAGYSEAKPFLILIREMYACEYHARSRAVGNESEKTLYAERRKVRKDSVKTVAEFFRLAEQIQSTEIPTSPLGKAVNYAIKQRRALELFLHDPRINIDNNPAENVIRPIALGRKNWLFAGSEEGGANLAVLASLAATCHRNNVNFRKWLNHVLIALPDTPISQVGNLLPHLCNGDD